jgi:hypothetical protein
MGILSEKSAENVTLLCETGIRGNSTLRVRVKRTWARAFSERVILPKQGKHSK